MTQGPRIGIIAPSAKLAQAEFAVGVAFLRSRGFKVSVHPQCKRSHLFFAGTDEERAGAFYDYAMSPDIDVLWAGRGGYGAFRTLAVLERLEKERGKPQPGKLFVGYSDSTALMEFVTRRWDWRVLHAAMPSLRKFSILDPKEWAATEAILKGEPARFPWSKLKFFRPATVAVTAPLVGGNLTVWSTLIGTAYPPSARERLLFLEDVDEAAFRNDRMMQHLLAAGALEGCKGIVLGDFLNCEDRVPNVLKAKVPTTPKARERILRAPKPSEMAPLRKPMPQKKALEAIFGEVGDRLGIPVAYGLPCGHGPGFAPLPLGVEWTLFPDGRFQKVTDTFWLRGASKAW